MRNSSSCGCCEVAGECEVYLDQFTDSDVEPFEVDDGSTWTATSQQLRTAENQAKAIYRETTITPGDQWSVEITTASQATVLGVWVFRWRLLFASVDNDNYWYAEFEMESFDVFTQVQKIRIVEVVSGSHTEHAVSTLGSLTSFQNLRVCYQDGVVSAFSTDSTLQTLSYSTGEVLGGEFGIGSGDLENANFLGFDTFRLVIDSGDGSNCDDCLNP